MASASSTVTAGVCSRDFDLRQPRRAARSFARFGDNGKNHLAMKFDLAVGKDGIAAKRRAAIIGAGNILGSQNRDDTGKAAHRIEIDG